MAGLPTFLVIVMAAVAVTSAWPRSLFAREAGDGPCSTVSIENAYRQCRSNAELPHLVHSVETVDIAAEVMVTIMEQYCEETAFDKVNCMDRWVDANGCPKELVDEAARTGRFCDGDVPADWLQEGLLDRMTDLREHCFVQATLDTCFEDHQDITSGQDLDDLIECFKRETDPDCDPIPVITTHLRYLLMDTAELGAEPSDETLQSLKNWP